MVGGLRMVDGLGRVDSTTTAAGCNGGGMTCSGRIMA